MNLIFFVYILFIVFKLSFEKETGYYDCFNGTYCRRVFSSSIEGDSLSECWLKCGVGRTLWPKPTGVAFHSNELIPIDIGMIRSLVTSRSSRKEQTYELKKAADAINQLIFGTLQQKFAQSNRIKSTGNRTEFKIVCELETDNIEFDYDVDEGYTLMFSATSYSPLQIYARHFLGYRNAMMTLLHLVAYNNRLEKFVIPSEILIRDSPKYPHRGVLIDTANNYLTIHSLNRLFQGLAISKINIVHWRITGKQSFPFIISSFPAINTFGSYDNRQVYTKFDLYKAALLARNFGIKLIPEVAPIGRLGAGWQWGPLIKEEDFITCFQSIHCQDRPCSQMNIDNNQAWEIWSSVQSQVTSVFSKWFYHLGGDDWHSSCLTTPPEQVSAEMQWAGAINKARDIVQKLVPNSLLKTIIFSGTHVTNTTGILKPEDYILQITENQSSFEYLFALQNGYDVIVSPKDTLDWQCGYGNWMNGTYGAQISGCETGQLGWQRAYDLKMPRMGETKGRILGAEGLLYSAQTDSSGFEEKILTRAAGLAERLWSDPETTHLDVFERLNIHVQNNLNFLGFRAETITPQWCAQNAGKCLLGQ